MNGALLFAGLVRVGIWAFGAIIAYQKRRWMLLAGCALAVPQAIVFSISSAQGHPPHWMVSASSYGATVVVALVIGSFVASQPIHAERPAKWTP